MIRATTVAGVVLAAFVALSGCSSGPGPAAPTAGPTETQGPTATPTPTETEPAEGTVEGDWCTTPESSETRCLTVKLPEVRYDDGSREKIVGDGFAADDGSTQYSFSGAPFGGFYPAGTPIELPDYYPGKDLPDQDRIWNSQTSVLLVRKEASADNGFPEELNGDWRSKDGSEAFSVDELLKSHPDAFLADDTTSEDVPGATDFSICLTADIGPGECTTSASMFLRYFPAGTSWDCAKAGREGKLPFDFTSCDPDFTSEHDPSQPRLIVMPNHQHDQAYVDSIPMYRSGK